MVVLLCVMFATEPLSKYRVKFRSCVIITDVYQGLSVIHFFGKSKTYAKRCNDIADGCGDNYYTSNTYHCITWRT